MHAANFFLDNKYNYIGRLNLLTDFPISIPKITCLFVNYIIHLRYMEDEYLGMQELFLFFLGRGRGLQSSRNMENVRFEFGYVMTAE